MNKFFMGLTMAGIFAGIFALYALSNLFLDQHSVHDLLIFVAGFACLGFLIGGIYAFDDRSDFKIVPSAIARILIGVGSAAMLSFILNWQRDALTLASLIGGALGYLGMTWVKYVDF